jgi:hypothetical protein
MVEDGVKPGTASFLESREGHQARLVELGRMVEPPDDEDLARAEIALALAGDLFKAELGTADTIDLKAVGLAAVDIAALALVVTFHKSVSAWPLSALALAVAGTCLFRVLLQRHWELGTEPALFWEENEGGSRLSMLESALASTERNRLYNQPFLVFKGFWFRWGYRFLAAGLGILLITTLSHIY